MDLVFSLPSILCLGFSKLSALFFFRRILCVGHRRDYFNYATIAGIIIVSCWTITFGTLVFFDCGTHLSTMWMTNRAVFDAECKNDYRILKGLTISAFLLDFLIVMLPIPKVDIVGMASSYDDTDISF